MSVATITLGIGRSERRTYRGYAFQVRTWEVKTLTNDEASCVISDLRTGVGSWNVTDVHYWDSDAQSGQGKWRQFSLI